VQDASNFSGVEYSFHEAMDVLREEMHRGRHGSDWLRRHPITRMFVHKLFSMTWYEPLDEKAMALYAEAYKACKEGVGIE
jgi:hypothetical protein